MFWIDLRNEEQVNWFMNKGLRLCRWKSVNWITDIHRHITHMAVKPVGLFSVIGWFKAKKYLYDY